MSEPVVTRTCGECTACCKTHAVFSINKEPNTWCAHCTIGVGCKRYDSRPEECREFACAWLTGEGKEDERPDKSKCVLGIDPVSEIGDAFTIHEMRAGALDASPAAQAWRRKGIAMNMPVFIKRSQGQSVLLIPPHKKLSAAVLRELKSVNIAVKKYEVLL
jgi:hypothetical protein